MGGHSRRDFLARAAAASVAVSAGSAAIGSIRLDPRVRRGPVRVPGKDDPILMGVIGTGGMGTGHCHAFCDIASRGEENVKIVAVADVCDSHLNGAKNACEEKQKISVDAYRDYRELLAREDIHGVLIASPEHWHAQHAIDALAAGKDVYCEKPMTLRLDEALTLREAVLSHTENMFQVGTQMMQLPKYHEARKLMQQGVIGHPTFSQTSYCRNSKDGEWLYYGIDPDWKPGVNLDWNAWLGNLGPEPWNPEIYARWRRYKKFSTGIIGDLLVHVVTPLVLALDDVGWPVRVQAMGGHYIDKAMENHDQVNINIQFEKDHTMIVAGSTCNEVGLETLIRGHKGNIYLGGRHCVVRPERLFVDDVDEQTVECPDIGNDQDVHRKMWLKAIRSRQHPPSGIDLGTKVMVIVDLATRSMWTGKAYTFDPKTMTAREA
jgi:predicted dehydrogenase